MLSNEEGSPCRVFGFSINLPLEIKRISARDSGLYEARGPSAEGVTRDNC